MDRLGNLDTLVLLATVAVYERTGRCTVRTVADAAGRGVQRTHVALSRLRRAGLVTWEDDTKGSLRPLVFHVQLHQPQGETP